LFRSRPFTDPTVSDEVSPHKQELPDLQTQLERGARFNQSLSRMKVYGNRPAIQPKIAVGAPGDKYEQEADQMAQQVMSMPAAISHPPIQRLERQEEEKEQVQTKPLAASITPLVQRETAPAELEEEKEPLQMKRSLEETAEVSIQRDGTDALPALPNYQLTPPSLLQPPDPSSRYGLGQNFQLHLDPEIQAMAFQHLQQQMEPATIRAALSQVNLGLTALPAPSASGPTATPTPNPFATPSPSPAAPLVPRGAGPDTPRPATAGDLMNAVLAVPAIDAWIRSLRMRATEQVTRDWRRLSTGEQVGAVSSVVAIGAGSLAGVLSDPNARQMALSQLNGRVLPVPGLNWLSLEINTEGDNLMLGGHVDIGSLLPPSLGFGPSSAQPIGGPPTPQPFVPGQPSVQREATPEAEEEKVQMKPLANAMIQRDAMPEAAEEVQTQLSLQRAAANGSHDASSNIESQLSSSQGGGSPLSEEVRSFMEPRFGTDFSQVRVHTDTSAVQMNRDLSAQAFAHGSDIYFGAGKYDPESSDGKRLLAHELTHVVQQTGGVQPKLTVGQPGDKYGQEADQVAEQVMQIDASTPLIPSATGVVQRLCPACQDEDKQLQRKAENNVPITSKRAISQEMIPGYVNRFMAKPQALLQRPIIQRAKIDHRQLTWGDFQGKAPKASSFDAATYSDFHDPHLKKLEPKNLKAVDPGQNCKNGKKDSTLFKVNIAIDPNSLEVKPYMWQEKSWAMPWNTDMKAREAKCKKDYVGKCETYFTSAYKRIESECKKTEQACKKAFSKEGTTSYGNDQYQATSKDECKTVVFEKCSELSKETLKWTGERGGEQATATSKSDCRTTFLNECSGRLFNAESAKLLEHEQAHFDITNVMAKETQAALRSLANGFDKEVQECSEAKALSKAKTVLAKNMKALKKEYDKNYKAWKSTQDKYDKETNHGVKITEQKDWEKNISQGLPN
jgi:hypothetical protein